MNLETTTTTDYDSYCHCRATAAAASAAAADPFRGLLQKQQGPRGPASSSPTTSLSYAGVMAGSTYAKIPGMSV